MGFYIFNMNLTISICVAFKTFYVSNFLLLYHEIIQSCNVITYKTDIHFCGKILYIESHAMACDPGRKWKQV